MTKAERRACTELNQLLRPALVGGRASDRTLRLFAVAFARNVGHLPDDEPSRRAVALAEAVADDGADPADLHLAVATLLGDLAAVRDGRPEEAYAGLATEVPPFEDFYPVDQLLLYTAVGPTSLCRLAGSPILWAKAAKRGPARSPRGTPAGVADLVRCVFGDPGRPAAFDPAWRTPTVLALAAGVYQDRAFDRLPILADALQEAGCEAAAVLAHCRGGAVHARGCWVVDAVLGKT